MSTRSRLTAEPPGSTRRSRYSRIHSSAIISVHSRSACERAPVVVLGQQPRHLGRHEEPARAHAIGGEQVVHRSGRRSVRSQRASGIMNPCLRWRSTSGGSTSAKAAFSSRLQPDARRIFTDGGMREARLDHAVIAERRAQLERVRHAHAVGHDEQVVRQVGRQVDAEGAVDGIVPAAGRRTPRARRASTSPARRARSAGVARAWRAGPPKKRVQAM